MYQVVKNEYQLLHTCITVEEIRYLLHHVKRYSPHYMYLLLRATTGMRSAEALQLTTRHLAQNASLILYRVLKPRRRHTRDGLTVGVFKHRRIQLDEWVASELRTYLLNIGREVNGEYVTAYQNNKLFPWSRVAVANAYWYKCRAMLRKAGFEADRMHAEWIRDNGCIQEKPVFVIRPHILRHFYASVMYVRFHYDIKRVQEEIQHSHIQTTQAYIHSPVQLGASEALLMAPWAVILNFDPQQVTFTRLPFGTQLSLDRF